MNATKISGTVALVTGANRGIGRAITEALLERGAAKVYAGARNPQSVDDLKARYGDRIVPLELDVTNADHVRAAAGAAGDLQLLINNAGVAAGRGLTGDTVVDQARREMEVNYFAPLRMLSSFAPALVRNASGAVVNIASIAGLSNFPMYPTYSASKAAVHSLTQGSRALLTGQGLSVYGVYPGPVDTDMTSEVEMEKATPESVANAVLDGIEVGNEDIFPDEFARSFGKQFHASPKDSERALGAMVAQSAETVN